jgi:putative RNA 2'-phosphotransferase
MIDPTRHTDVSKTMAHALRHAPADYGLALADGGWVPLRDLVDALRRRRPDFADLDEEDVLAILARAAKQRYEACDGRIRALYGHSVPDHRTRAGERPPAVLYHGTDPAVVPLILAEGLKPMRRQFVHLAVDRATALQVGARKAGRPVLLTVDAAGADAAGCIFYRGNATTWLARAIPPAHVRPADGASG